MSSGNDADAEEWRRPSHMKEESYSVQHSVVCICVLPNLVVTATIVTYTFDSQAIVSTRYLPWKKGEKSKEVKICIQLRRSSIRDSSLTSQLKSLIRSLRYVFIPVRRRGSQNFCNGTAHNTSRIRCRRISLTVCIRYNASHTRACTHAQAVSHHKLITRFTKTESQEGERKKESQRTKEEPLKKTHTSYQQTFHSHS